MKQELVVWIVSIIIQYGKHQPLAPIFLIGALVTVGISLLTGFSRVATFAGSLAMLAVALV